MSDVRDNITCTKCKKTMLADNFYMSRNTEKFAPDGRVDLCKKCLTMHVNNWEPSTFLNILEMIDVPYIETEWDTLLDRYGKDPKKTSSTAIIGRYLAKMKLNQYKTLRYADTLRLREEEEKKKAIIKYQEDAQRNRYSASLQNGEGDIEEGNIEEDLYAQPEMPPVAFEEMVTAEEKRMLSLKWGRLYQLEEWVSLEKFYQEMMESFDIQSAAHLDYLKKICKTSLKMDQAIDCGDVEGFQKLSKVYDSLMKSAKFTAAQNKAESDEYMDCLGEMITLCEEEGFIPRYSTEEAKDIVDITLKDMNGYTRKLIMEEMNLGNMIENALAQMKHQEEQDEGELDESDDFLNPDEQDVLDDADFNDYNEFIDEQVEMDEALAALKKEKEV